MIAHVLKVDRKKLIEIYLKETHKLIIDVRLGTELDFALELSDRWRDDVLQGKDWQPE